METVNPATGEITNGKPKPKPVTRTKSAQEFKQAVDEESKREKFERIASRRTKQTIKAMRMLAGMGGRNAYSYEFGQDDVDKIVHRLKAEVDSMANRLIPPGRQLDIEFDL